MTNSRACTRTEPCVILLVDDNPFHLRIASDALEKAGYQMLVAESGEAALSVIEKEGLPDLAIVDYHMAPGMSGFEFCDTIHQYSDVPIIMLTAVDEEDTILEGLEKHAEDYMVKPFGPGELVARTQRLMRRVGPFAFEPGPITQIDQRLAINFPQRNAIVHEEAVSLTPTETKLLYLLVREAGDVVSTGFIIRRLWPLEPAFEDRLHVHMHRLRRKIEKEGTSAPTYIISRRGEGYIFRVPENNENKP